MPSKIIPMLAKLSEMPEHQEEFGFEFKWDGIRAILEVNKGKVRIHSRNQLDLTEQYPELQGLAEALKTHRAVLDGEIVALGKDGRPHFEALQERMGLTATDDIERVRRRVPVYIFLFDILKLDGKDLTKRAYTERRAILEQLKLSGPFWKTPPMKKSHGDVMLRTSVQVGLEGVMAKRLDSPYQAGKRTGQWLKIKTTNRQEFVIGGWTEGEGNRENTIGSLALGVYDKNKKLQFAGLVGTGFGFELLDQLKKKFETLEVKRCPFAKKPTPVQVGHRIHYIRPLIVCEVEFFEWTSDGLLRHPSFKGLRTDKKPTDVIRETIKR